MAKIKYFIKGKMDPATIYVRFSNGRKFDLKKTTTILIDPEYWNNNKGEVRQIAEFKGKKNIQNKLIDLKAQIQTKFNDDNWDGQEINSFWLESIIDDFFNKKETTDLNYLTEFYKHIIKNLPNRVFPNSKTGASENTIKRYNTVKNKISEYETSRKMKLKLYDVNLKFYNDFKYFLNLEQKLNLNTVGSYISNLKAVCNEAKEQGIKTHPDFEKKSFRPTSEKTTFITLSESEIQTIYKHDFSKKPYLNNARNWLIIGIWTGARVSDLLHFNNSNIQNDFIEYTAKKTDQKIILPIHAQVKEILNQNNGQFPNPISSQKFNDYIKKVCKEAGIETLVTDTINTKIKKGVWRKKLKEAEKWNFVTSHVCRRTFATIHYGKLPTPVIMAITGHKTEKMFLRYIGKTAMDDAQVLNKYWNLQEQKKNKEVKMNVIKTGTHE